MTSTQHVLRGTTGSARTTKNTKEMFQPSSRRCLMKAENRTDGNNSRLSARTLHPLSNPKPHLLQKSTL